MAIMDIMDITATDTVSASVSAAAIITITVRDSDTALTGTIMDTAIIMAMASAIDVPSWFRTNTIGHRAADFTRMET